MCMFLVFSIFILFGLGKKLPLQIFYVILLKNSLHMQAE